MWQLKLLSLWHVFLSWLPWPRDTFSSMHFESGICRTSSPLFTTLSHAYRSEQYPIILERSLAGVKRLGVGERQHLEACACGSSFIGRLMISLNDGLKHRNCFLLLQKNVIQESETLKPDLWTSISMLPNTFEPNTYSSSHTQVWRVFFFKWK